MKAAKKTYLVGLDGSALSLRAVQVAAQLADQYNDNVVFVSLSKDQSDKSAFEVLATKAKSIAQRCGVPLTRVYSEFVLLTETWKIQDALVFLGNHTCPGGAMLVVGAAGKGHEQKSGSRPVGQPEMGSLAKACLERCKQPTILVKNGEPPPAGNDRIKRVGRHGSPGLNIMVCLDPPPGDGSDVSRKAFDTALTLSTKSKVGRLLDNVFLYHVDMCDEVTETVKKEYSIYADKLSGSVFNSVSLHLDKQGTGKEAKPVRSMIDDFVHIKKIDVVIMGSRELSEPGKQHFLGSVSSHVAKTCAAHVCIVKNFAYTW